DGLGVVRMETTGNGALMLPTPEGDLSLPRGTTVDFLGGEQALVTSPDGVSQRFLIQDGQFVKTGDPFVRPTPAGAGATGVSGDDVVEGTGFTVPGNGETPTGSEPPAGQVPAGALDTALDGIVVSDAAGQQSANPAEPGITLEYAVWHPDTPVSATP